jgi:hypothetical protein
MPCAIRVPSTFARSHDSPLHGTNLRGRAAMTTASPQAPRDCDGIAYPPRRPRGSGTAMSRGSGRLTLHARFGYEHWPAMLAPAKTVVGSGKRPTQTTARRLRYGVARTDTSDFSAPRGSHHCGDMWIHRIGCCAEEQAARTRVLSSGLLLWIDGRRDPARKASRPERARSRRPLADVRPLRAGIRRGTGRFAARALTFAPSHLRL